MLLLPLGYIRVSVGRGRRVGYHGPRRYRAAEACVLVFFKLLAMAHKRRRRSIASTSDLVIAAV